MSRVLHLSVYFSEVRLCLASAEARPCKCRVVEQRPCRRVSDLGSLLQVDHCTIERSVTMSASDGGVVFPLSRIPRSCSL